jgi:hypothetical protein
MVADLLSWLRCVLHVSRMSRHVPRYCNYCCRWCPHDLQSRICVRAQERPGDARTRVCVLMPCVIWYAHVHMIWYAHAHMQPCAHMCTSHHLLPTCSVVLVNFCAIICYEMLNLIFCPTILSIR